MDSRELVVRKVNLGFIAVVGCQTFVFTSKDSLYEAMELFWSDPETAECKYVERDEAAEIKRKSAYDDMSRRLSGALSAVNAKGGTKAVSSGVKSSSDERVIFAEEAMEKKSLPVERIDLPDPMPEAELMREVPMPDVPASVGEFSVEGEEDVPTGR